MVPKPTKFDHTNYRAFSMKLGPEYQKNDYFGLPFFNWSIWKNRSNLTLWQVWSHFGILEHFWRNSFEFFFKNDLEYQNDSKVIRESNFSLFFILFKKNSGSKNQKFLVFRPQIHRKSFVICLIKFSRSGNHKE